MLRLFTLLSLTLSLPLPAIEPEELAKRQCRSVHLRYQKVVNDPSYAVASATVEKSAPGTYFCALGFHMGYIGMQELANGKKRIIFSIWEPEHGQDPKLVPEDQRAKLLRKGDGVRTGRFGNEGTGGQSFFDYDWKKGETVQFAVRSLKLNDSLTRYTGYFYDNQKKQWQLMTEFQTQSKAKQLGNHIYSFVEDFRRNYESAKITRRASYSAVFTSDNAKDWSANTNTRFTADHTPSENVDAGPAPNGFFLETGGGTEQNTSKLWSKMQTKYATQHPPLSVPSEWKTDSSAPPVE